MNIHTITALVFQRILPRLFLSFALWLSLPAYAEKTYVAVASNFLAPAKEMSKLFEKTTGHKALLSFGSTGKLFAQIANGAPFQVFLAADTQRPQKALDEGFAVDGSQFTYAKGKLALFSKQPLKAQNIRGAMDNFMSSSKFAIANPSTAPYGMASIEVFKALGFYEKFQKHLVQGENIAQTYQFVVTGAAALGFVALAQVKSSNSGYWLLVPKEFYTPISQNAVLLEKGRKNTASLAFLAFLKSPQAKSIIMNYGYEID